MKNPTKTILASIATIIISGAILSHQAQATPITGEIDMGGTVTLDSIFLGSATQTLGYASITVGGVPTGSFAGTVGDSVTWTNFGWSPFFSTPPLWSFTDVGTGYTYSFDLNSIPFVFQNNNFLNMLGVGTLDITGPGSPYTPTIGLWSFTISNPGGGAHQNFEFTFANSQVSVPTPDGGSAVALLGVAIAGIEILRRKLRTA